MRRILQTHVKEGWLMSMASQYAGLARAYKEVVEQFSPNAGAGIEKINASYGPHAAYCAALATIYLRTRLTRTTYVPNLAFCADFMSEYPEAIPDLEFILECYLADWRLTGERTPQKRVSRPM